MIDSFRGKYRFLSNFYPCGIGEEHSPDIVYTTLEAAYQAAKCVSPEQRALFSRIDPFTAKKLGRKVKCRPNWDKIKVDIMRGLLKVKFAYGTKLADRLIKTGDEELVEGNNWGDNFWGKVDGEGENWLGKLLMERREELQRREELR